MSDLFFETPWWLPTLIAIAGIFLFITGNRRTQSRMRNAGLTVFLLAPLLILVSYLVDTPKERAVAGTKNLVESFQKQDWSGFARDLSPKVGVTLRNSPGVIYSNREQLLAAAKAARDMYRFKSVHVLSIDAEQTGTLITVVMKLFTDQEMPPQPITSGWQFDWQESAQGWSISQITALEVANQPIEQVRPKFPR